MCKGCGESFHVMFNPPREEGVCDRCKGELYQRDDDNEETIRQRLKVYNEQTSPLIEFYRDMGTLREIDGASVPSEIFSRIERAIGG